MKILIIGHPLSRDRVTSFTSMWMHYLPLALQQCGVDIEYHPWFNSTYTNEDYIDSVLKSAESCDHILAPGVRYFTQIPNEIGSTLRKKFKGVVAHTYDGTLLDTPQVDLTLTIKDDSTKFAEDPLKLKRHEAHNRYIGWAADPEMFYPEPGLPLAKEHLSIFIDHSTFDPGQQDWTLTAFTNLLRIPESVKWSARTLTDAGLVDVPRRVEEMFVSLYRRTGVPVEDFARELRTTHIFMVTHPESLGQTVIEAAMAGCLILTPPNCIPQERLNHVPHMFYDGRIDWTQILQKLEELSKEQIHNKVKNHNWVTVACNIINSLGTYNK